MSEITAPTRRIGRYVLGEVLGRGAMGVVYKAEDPLIARTVAVKLLHVTKALSPEQAATVRERFLREAQTAGNLDHPNIVRVLDAGCDDETMELYLVMEYLPGSSLDALVQQGSLAREKICDLVRQISSALDAAHARGVIHRDIKPANILFADAATAKIADFGIARIATSDLTQDMRDLGTPIYMSPEQLAGRTLDGRADLFSLGVMAYHLLTGVPPFSGKNTVSVAYQIVHSTPPLPSTVAPDLPPALDRVMARILAKNPDDRYGSGREFYEDFSRVLMGLPHDTKLAKAPKPWRGALDPRLLSLLGIALVGAALLGSPRGFRKALPPAQQPPRASMQPALVTAPPAARPVAPESRGPAAKALPKVEPAAVSKSARPPASRSGSNPSEPKPKPDVAPAVTRAREIDLPAERIESARPDAPRESPKPALPVRSKESAAAGGTLNLRLGHRIQRGTLQLLLDGTPLISDQFEKRNRLLPYQTSEWLGISVPLGRHEVTARVESGKGKVMISEPYALDVNADQPLDLRLVLKDDSVLFKRGD